MNSASEAERKHRGCSAALLPGLRAKAQQESELHLVFRCDTYFSLKHYLGLTHKNFSSCCPQQGSQCHWQNTLETAWSTTHSVTTTRIQETSGTYAVSLIILTSKARYHYLDYWTITKRTGERTFIVTLNRNRIILSRE